MFYEKLEKTLKEQNLTLNRLAKKCKIAQSQTTKWKKGFLPGTEILKKICQTLNVSADYLLDLEDEAPPPPLTEPEQRLIDNFRQCDPGTQKSIQMLAKSGAEEALSKETSFSSIIAG